MTSRLQMSLRERGVTPAPKPPSFDLLSHFRWIAAIVVVLSHIQQDILGHGGFTPFHGVYPTGLVTTPLFQLEGYGHAAVVVFFVLSGFLVGGKLIELVNSQNIGVAWRQFLVDRFCRIFVVLWPALLLTAVVFAASMVLAPNAPFVKSGNWTFNLLEPVSYDMAFSRWLGAAFLLNGFVVPTLESNNPLWSLAYEWFYYIVALAAVLLWRRVVSVGAVLVICYAAALLVVGLWLQPDILFSGLIWLTGLCARVVFNRGVLRGRLVRACGVGLVLGVLVIDSGHPLPDLALGIALGFMIAHAGWGDWRCYGGIGERLAGFSYSLYVIHFPVLLAGMVALSVAGALPHPLGRNSGSIVIGVVLLVVILAVARVFAYLTEDRTRMVKRQLFAALRIET